MAGEPHGVAHRAVRDVPAEASVTWLLVPVPDTANLMQLATMVVICAASWWYASRE